MNWTYKEKPIKKLRDWYNDKVRKEKNGFLDIHDFLEWYKNNIKDSCCYYCGLTEKECQRIVHLGILQSKRFPKDGLFSRGVSRGYWLEIDRKDPDNTTYSKENCVPSCYFCNNDKSDVFTDLDYKLFYQNRREYLISLIPKIVE